MITDHFLNTCITVCLSNSGRVTDPIIQDIQDILLTFEKTAEVPLEINQKFALLKILCDFKMAGKTKDTIIDSIVSFGQFVSMKDYLILKSNEVEDDKISDYVKQIRCKKKFSLLLKDFNKLSKFVEDFDTSEFDSLEKVVVDYEDLISDIYSIMAEEKRKDNISKVSSLSLRNDNYTNVFDQIKLNYSGVNTVPTGYQELDKLMRGGYDPGRLYVFGGASGDGKSAYLINNIKNAVEKDSRDKDGLINVYAYISLENLIDESLLRLYSSWSQKDYDKILTNWDSERRVAETFLRNKVQVHNAEVDIQYKAPDTFTVFDLRVYIQSLRNAYKGKGRLRAVYVDYLDLLKSAKSFDVYRLELGYITLLLKVVAVAENIPIITATQLNRDGYDKGTFSLTQMGESIKKVEHSDFVALLKAQLPDAMGKTRFQDLDVYIGKNRCGAKDKKITLRADFSKFNIEDSSKGVGLGFTLFSNTDDSDGFI
jgi:replicative DNA helicase